MARPRKPRPTSVRIFEGADGSWHGYLTVGVRPDGRPDRRHRSAPTEEECAAKIRELEDELNAKGKVAGPGRPPTVEQWLRHWCEVIARPSVSYKTYVGSYAYAVYRYLIPGVGAHRIDHLEPDHLEELYHDLLGTEEEPGLSPGTVALIHRTVRTALNEAVRRRRITENPALIAKAPEAEADEVDPLTADECRRLVEVIAGRRNGVRWLIGMLGLRQGEILGLLWTDVDLNTGMVTIRGQAQRRKWRHGCDDPATCARWRHGCTDRATCTAAAVACPRREIRCRTKPCPTAWAHGCTDRPACAAKQGRACPSRQPAHCPKHRGDCPPACPDGCAGHASACPDRVGGGIVIDDGAEREERRRRGRRRIRPKSRAGRRRFALPAPLLLELGEHRRRQLEERIAAGTLWEDHGLVFATVLGRPVDARRDWADWKDILTEAGVRNVPVHMARHTAATMLLAKGVDRRVVMDILGWSSERMLVRYQHVADELRHEAAKRLGEAYGWTTADESATDRATDGRSRPNRIVRGRKNRRPRAV